MNNAAKGQKEKEYEIMRETMYTINCQQTQTRHSQIQTMKTNDPSYKSSKRTCIDDDVANKSAKRMKVDRSRNDSYVDDGEVPGCYKDDPVAPKPSYPGKDAQR